MFHNSGMTQNNSTDNFFDFGSTGLDGNACALILKKLGDPVCNRFLGNPIVSHGFSETTADHVVRTYQNIERLVHETLGPSAQRSDYLHQAKAQLMVHDMSDIIKEVILASTETDPVLKAQCQTQLHNYDMTITPFVYKLALYSSAYGPMFFSDTIDQIREDTLESEQRDRGFRMDEAINFCHSATRLVGHLEKGFRNLPKWDAAKLQMQTDIMMTHYNAIETQTNFIGMQTHIHEKCDGTDYCAAVSQEKIDQKLGGMTHFHVPPHILNRINGRYEGKLAGLLEMAGDSPEYQAMALKTMSYCYGVSHKVYTLSKPYFSLTALENEPKETDPQEAHDTFSQQKIHQILQQKQDLMPHFDVAFLYKEAAHSVSRFGKTLVPEKGKTLIESEDAQFYELPSHARALVLKNR